MTDRPLSSFPAHVADRSFHLSGIEWHTEKSEVASLLVDVGISHNYFRIYWDTRPPPNGHHRGYCFVEFWGRQLAVLAWSRLDGLPKWGRVLTVRPVNRQGALQPSLDELIAARSQQASSSANRPLQPNPRRPRDKLHQIPVHTTHRVTKNCELTSRSSIQARSRLSRHWTWTSGRISDAVECPIANTDKTSHEPSPKPPTKAVKDIWSDPSLLETIQRNADKVGPGWGGYAPFQADPLRGPIDPSEVQALNWHDPTPFRYIDVDGDVVLHVSVSLANKREERNESLWFVLAKASGEMTDEELREKEKTLPSPRDAEV